LGRVWASKAGATVYVTRCRPVSSKEFPAIISTYPSLTEVRQNERFNFWRSLCKREAGMEDEVAASVPERGQEGEWQPMANEANGLPKIF
jgi:hypothetical protein